MNGCWNQKSRGRRQRGTGSVCCRIRARSECGMIVITGKAGPRQMTHHSATPNQKTASIGRGQISGCLNTRAAKTTTSCSARSEQLNHDPESSDHVFSSTLMRRPSPDTNVFLRDSFRESAIDRITWPACRRPMLCTGRVWNNPSVRCSQTVSTRPHGIHSVAIEA